MAVIPFYGAHDPVMFAIERAAMDRPGKVIAALDDLLPDPGRVLDIGAGDGFTARRLTTTSRTVVAMEPAAGMISNDRPLPWVRGDAEAMPFATAAVDAAYATWAYFFPPAVDPVRGLAEANRVTRRGGPIVIVDNLGEDEFGAMADRHIGADVGYWEGLGFSCIEIETAFVFETLADARTLLGFFFGEAGRDAARLEIQFRVGAFVTQSVGA